MWTVYSEASFTHFDYAGAIYENKIYIPDPYNPEVFDPVSNIWTQWPKSMNYGYLPCSLTWKDTFLQLGGYTNRRGVQSFSHLTQTWTDLYTSSSTMDVYYSGCVVLPNENVLVVGSGSSCYG